MRLAAQHEELGAGLLWRGGFAKGAAVKFKHLVAAKHQGLGGLVGKLAGLHFGQGIGNIARMGALGLQRGADALLVDAGGICGDGDACIAQQRQPGFGGGSEKKVSRHGWGQPCGKTGFVHAPVLGSK